MRVVVLDTGCNLEGVEKYNCVSYEDMKDYNGHGTQMSRIIREVAPNAEVISVKVCDRGGSTVNDVLCQGLVKCIELDVDIINISLGLDYSSINVKSMIDVLVAKGVKIVCASGNQKMVYPSRYRGSVISVGACDEYGNLCDYTIEDSYDVLECGVYEYKDIHGHIKKIEGTSVSCARYVGRLAKELSDNG